VLSTVKTQDWCDVCAVRAQPSSHAVPPPKSPFLLHSPTASIRGITKTPAVDMSTAVKPGISVFSLSATPSTSSYYQGTSRVDIIVFLLRFSLSLPRLSKDQFLFGWKRTGTRNYVWDMSKFWGILFTVIERAWLFDSLHVCVCDCGSDWWHMSFVVELCSAIAEHACGDVHTVPYDTQMHNMLKSWWNLNRK